VNNHPHSGWLDFALKGRKQKKRSVEAAFFRELSPYAMVFMKTINLQLLIFRNSLTVWELYLMEQGQLRPTGWPVYN
jgi:hypothetical protein